MFVSTVATSQIENKKKNPKKDFEINFDDDIDFDTYFIKTKVCARFICICAFYTLLPLSLSGMIYFFNSLLGI